MNLSTGEKIRLNLQKSAASGATLHASAVTLGSRGGKVGGPARARKLSKKRRQQIARMGALARNAKKPGITT